MNDSSSSSRVPAERRRTLILVLPAVLLGALAGVVLSGPLAGLFGGDEDQGQRERPPTSVRLATPEKATAIDYVATVGAVRAEERVILTPEMAGVVKQVAVADGARVEAGEVILELRDAPQIAALEAARARLREARASLARALELDEEGFATEAEIDTARAAFAAAESEVERREEMLDDRTVRAPFAGALGLIDISPGAYLSPGTPIVELASVDRLRLRFSLPSAEANRLEPGTMIRFRLGEGAGWQEAPLRVLSPLTDEGTRLVQAEAAITAKGSYRPGDFVAVQAPLDRREDALFISVNAVVYDGRATNVFVVRDGKAVRTPVELGVREDERVEIREGVAADARIVVEGMRGLSDGAPVREAGSGTDAAQMAGGNGESRG